MKSAAILLGLLITGLVARQQARGAEPFAGMDVLDDVRVLRPGDRVSLRIVEDRGEPSRVFIQSDGDIQCPHLGPVHAAGLTCKKLAGAIKIAWERKYYAKAAVIVALDFPDMKVQSDPAGPGFIIFGSGVNRQGRYELAKDEKLTTSQAILRAGGWSGHLKTRCKVVRRTAKGSETRSVDLAAIMRGQKDAEDIEIRDGDVIILGGDRPSDF